MTWPSKDTRKIVVGGESFLWHVHESRVGWADAPITVGREGSKFVLHLDAFSWDGTPKPSIVAEAIRWALAKGWTPETGPTRGVARLEPGRFVFLARGERVLPRRSDDAVWFEVESVLERGRTIMAARLDRGDFRLLPDTRLNGLPIEPHLSMPRATDADGSPRFDLFVFAMQAPATEILVGELVLLGPIDTAAKGP